MSCLPPKPGICAAGCNASTDITCCPLGTVYAHPSTVAIHCFLPFAFDLAKASLNVAGGAQCLGALHGAEKQIAPWLHGMPFCLACLRSSHQGTLSRHTANLPALLPMSLLSFDVTGVMQWAISKTPKLFCCQSTPAILQEELNSLQRGEVRERTPARMPTRPYIPRRFPGPALGQAFRNIKPPSMRPPPSPSKDPQVLLVTRTIRGGLTIKL